MTDTRTGYETANGDKVYQSDYDCMNIAIEKMLLDGWAAPDSVDAWFDGVIEDALEFAFTEWGGSSERRMLKAMRDEEFARKQLHCVNPDTHEPFDRTEAQRMQDAIRNHLELHYGGFVDGEPEEEDN